MFGVSTDNNNFIRSKNSFIFLPRSYFFLIFKRVVVVLYLNISFYNIRKKAHSIEVQLKSKC